MSSLPRDVRLLLLGQTGASLGAAVAWFAIPILVFGITHSPVKAGLVGTIFM